MNLLERNAMVTITPGFESVPETLSQYRWKMHLSLPYPFPAKECVHQSITIFDKPFSFSIHNHYSRIIQTVRSEESGPVYFRVLLEDKRLPCRNYVDCVGFTREDLQSVVIFEETTDYPTPKEAFARADAKIGACFEWLSSFLSACQRAAPYLASWLVYPISMFDVGTVYHEVLAFCANHKQWHLFSSAVAVSLGRHLQRPTFVMEVPTTVESGSPMDAANELLAEALMSLFRGMPRLTVLNAYTAVESLANVVFSRTKVAMLVSNNMPQAMAEEIVEDERKRHRTEGNFLYHRGIKTASGRSLLEENKTQYDALLRLQELRHKVAHTGYKPTTDEAREAQKVCCETAQWLAGVAGFSTKPLLPDASASYPGFSTAFKDAQARSTSEIELVRHLLGAVQSTDDVNA
jgi:hypothetical protein